MRLFLALPLPETLRTQLGWIQSGVPDARWVEAQQLHVTLRFLGDVDAGTADLLDAALTRIAVPSFELTLGSVGLFTSGDRNRVLWAGVGASQAHLQLHGKVERAAADAGLPPEQRRYTPHVTLARLHDARGPYVERWIAAHMGLSLPPFRVTEYVLYESVPGGAGPTYVPLQRYPLA